MVETLFAKVALLLTLSMFMGAAGAYLGRNIRSLGAVLGLGLLFLVGCFGVFLAASAGPVAGIIALGGWTFVSGLFIGPAIQAYSEELGWRTVSMAYLGTAGVMAVCGGIGMFSGADFSGLGTYLSIALFGLIIAGIIAMFVRSMNTRGFNIVYSLLGMLVFAGYFLFDFFRLSRSENTWEKAIQLTMSIYLDFMNFFLDLLRLLAALQDKS